MNPFDLPGPQFLSFFAVLLLVLFAAGIAARMQFEGSSNYGWINDPYAIAYLRAGPIEAVDVAAATLHARGHLKFSGDRLVSTVDPAAATTELERRVLETFRSEDTPELLFDKNLHALADTLYRTAWTERGALPSSKVIFWRAVIFGTIALLILAVALVKIGIALGAGRSNVGFLVLMSLTGAVAAVFLSGRTRRTLAGTATLRELESLFTRLRTRASSSIETLGYKDLSYLLGIFGFSVIPAASFPFLSEGQKPKQKLYEYSRNRCSTGCSTARSSCSSSSSSCSSSSSSCSSGSSCGGGGGCGGCGS